MTKLHIGVGGIPITSAKNTTESGIARVKELGLDLMEMEFVYGVKMTAEKALEVSKVRAREDIFLTVHGPYFINLASSDNRKFYASIKHIVDSLYIGGIAGAKSVTFHSAFYQNLSSLQTYEYVKKAIGKIYEEFEKPKYQGSSFKEGGIVMAPELTGKPTQFGDLEELIQLCQEFEALNVRFCFDFAHKFARSNGKFNTYEEFMRMLTQIEDALSTEFLQNMHMHVSAMNYGEKGEKNHLTFLQTLEEYEKEGVSVDGIANAFSFLEQKGKTKHSELNWRDLLRALKDKKVGGYLVCESPILELDALLLKEYYQKV